MAASVLLHRNAGDVVTWSGNEPMWFREPRKPTEDDLIEQGDAMLRADGIGEPTAMRMAAMAAEIDDLKRQLRDGGAAQ